METLTDLSVWISIEMIDCWLNGLDDRWGAQLARIDFQPRPQDPIMNMHVKESYIYHQCCKILRGNFL